MHITRLAPPRPLLVDDLSEVWRCATTRLRTINSAAPQLVARSTAIAMATNQRISRPRPSRYSLHEMDHCTTVATRHRGVYGHAITTSSFSTLYLFIWRSGQTLLESLGPKQRRKRSGSQHSLEPQEAQSQELGDAPRPFPPARVDMHDMH